MSTSTPFTGFFKTGPARYQDLAIKDLIEARDNFHIHLMRKENVVGTAIGKFRVRNADLAGDKIKPKRTFPRPKRTLSTSRVVPESWPCILVFVSAWITDAELKKKRDYDKIIPTKVYMPDGREVPICVVEATRTEVSSELVNMNEIIFPVNYLGGGFPLILQTQGVERIASIGCIVSDGNKYYALTNKHVVGTAGDIIYTKLKGTLIPIGKSSAKTVSNIEFNDIYPDWKVTNQFLNMDIGLIEIDDISYWKTDIFRLGSISKFVDLNATNLTLNLIGCPVNAYGAVSGKLNGEIAALFYRYKSVGGYDYVSDFLIGPTGNANILNTKHGDSGTVWAVETKDDGETKHRPIAIQWGAHTFIENGQAFKNTYALATCLSNVLRLFEIDIIRDWNLEQDYSWGKVGHYTIANLATQLVKNTNLKKLVKDNLELISFQEDLLSITKIDKQRKTLSYTPLADVPDLIWKLRGGKYKRGKEGPNHFADMDKKDSKGKTLLDYCKGKGKNMQFLTPAEWLTYYTDKDVKDPSKGILPFRVWQIFAQMVDSVTNGDVNGYLAAAGILSHYIGDACQPLHISYMFNGIAEPGKPKKGEGVHHAWEETMINKYNQSDILPKSKTEMKKAMYKTLISIKSGKEAAATTVDLMRDTFTAVDPGKIVKTFIKNEKKKDLTDILWTTHGKASAHKLFVNGAYTLASLWQAAWLLGDGNKNLKDTSDLDVNKIEKLYQGDKFIPSCNIKEIQPFLL